MLRLFAQAREAAGTASDTFADVPSTVGEALEIAVARYGQGFAAVLRSSQVWVNGEPAAVTDPLAAGDEIAVLPPVSGGCVDRWR